MRPVVGLGLAIPLLIACATTTGPRGSSQEQISTQVSIHGVSHTLDLTRSTDAWETSLDAGVSRVWRAVPRTYEHLGLTGGGLLAAGERRYAYRGRMPARLDGRRASAYLRCGRGVSGENADEYDVRVQVVTSVEAEAGGSLVSTRVDATATPRGVSAAPVHCTSTGELERRIAEALLEATAG